MSHVALPVSGEGDEMNIDIGYEAQEAVDGGAVEEFFPAATRRLPQDDLCDVALVGYFGQGAGDIVALSAYDFSAKVFSQYGVFLQAFLSRLVVLLGLTAIFEHVGYMTYKGGIAFQFDRESDEIGMQAMS